LAKENWSPNENWKLPLKKGFNKMTEPKKHKHTRKTQGLFVILKKNPKNPKN
jgi:hypothetical protein